jgi:hypothetical protein
VVSTTPLREQQPAQAVLPEEQDEGVARSPTTTRRRGTYPSSRKRRKALKKNAVVAYALSPNQAYVTHVRQTWRGEDR